MIDSAETRIPPIEDPLLRRIVGRDVSALGELYDLHSSHLYALIWRILGDQFQADLALTETFEQVWEQSDRTRSQFGSSLAWLTRTARDIAVNRLRPNQFAAPEKMRKLPKMEGVMGWHGEIMEAISKLPVEEWSLIEYAYFHGYTRTKLAEYFEIPVEAVKTSIHQGVQSLSVRLQHIVGERVAPIGSLYLDELAALDAVGALEGEDVGEFNRNAPNVNTETQREMARYREVAALFSSCCVCEKQPPAVLRERLLKLI
ncbi:MAG TPA: hypothetical protein DGH68_07115 [Bacteroidetes bacterium]|nr:hypothetical protein [Bacteroidota bacterium]